MEDKKVKAGSVAVGICLFVIAILLVLIVLVFYNSNMEKNKLQEQISELETTIDEKENKVNELLETSEKENAEGKFIDYSKDTTIVEDGNSEVINGENSLKYSLLREYDYSHEFYQKYCSSYEAQGDSAAWEIVESNYGKNSPIKIGKYTKKIEAEIVVLNEMVQTDIDTMTQKERATIMWNSIKDDNFYKDCKYQLNGISIMNGNNNSEEEYKNNARAKKIKVTVNNDNSYIYELKDTNKPQLFDINIEQEDISKVMTVSIEVIEVYDGLISNDIYINEIGLGIYTGGLGSR